MGTLYGKYPKRISCQCNAAETVEETITIYLNDRCPVCNSLYQVCVPKPKVKMKVIHGEQAA